jgi:hypothetical protein
MQNVNGSDVVASRQRLAVERMFITNNIITNNVAGWDGAESTFWMP